MSRPDRLARAVAALAVAYLAVRFVTLWVEPSMGDFDVYVHAGRVSAAGGDPYDSGALASVSAGRVTLPYVYPPYFLPFARGAAAFPGAAARLWVLAQAFGVAVTVLVALRLLASVPARSLFLVYAAVGFHEALMKGVRHGNVTTLETAALWTALLAFQRGRRGLFAALVVLAASVKGLPIVFLGLLLIRPASVRLLSVALGAFLLLQGAAWAVDPSAYGAFLDAALALDERGGVNPSSLALLRDLGVPHPVWLHAGLAVLLAASFLLGARRGGRAPSPAGWIWGAVCLYALVAPRMKDYAYALLLIPAVWTTLTLHARSRLAGAGFAALVVLGLFDYQSLFLAALMYALWLGDEDARRSAPVRGAPAGSGP